MNPKVQKALEDSINPLKYRSKIIIDYEAFCLHLYDKFLSIDDKMRKADNKLPLTIKMNYPLFKKYYTTLHKYNEKYKIDIYPFYEERPSCSDHSTNYYGLKLLKDSGLSDLAGIDVDEDFSDLEQIKALTQLKRSDDVKFKDKLSCVSFDFEEIQKKYKNEIELNTRIAHIVASVNENAFLGNYLILSKAQAVQFIPERFSKSDRLCAVIDILGFKKLVEDNAKAPEFNNSDSQFEAADFLYQLIKIVQKNVAGNTLFVDIGDMKDMLSSITFSTFSDTIVVSTNYLTKVLEIDVKIKCFKFFLDIIMTLQYNLLCHKMLTRGAITFGNMYHYGTFYSGTAFQQAYEYGDKENRHPIVKIHESAINLIPTSTINSMKKENILSKSLALGFFLTPLKPNLPQEKMNEWNTWFISKCANSKGNNCYDAVLLYSKIFYKIILHKALKYKRPSPPAGFASGRVYLRLAKLFYNTIYIDKSKIDKSSSERIREKYLFLQSIFSN